MLLKFILIAGVQGLIGTSPAAASEALSLESAKSQLALAVKSLINEQGGRVPRYWMFKQEGRKNPRRLKLIGIEMTTVKARGANRHGAWVDFLDSDDGSRLIIDFTVDASSRGWKVAGIRLHSQRKDLDPRNSGDAVLLKIIKTNCLPHPLGQQHHGVYGSSPAGFYLVKNDPPSDIPDCYLDSHGEAVGAFGFEGETLEGAAATQAKFGNIKFDRKICD